jgi:hypothetical protein
VTTLKNKLLAYLAVMALMLVGWAIEACRDDRAAGKRTALAIGVIAALVAVLLLAGVFVARARDLGQWDKTDTAIRQWYQGLMQPDVPAASCCGEADAYYADEVHVRDGKVFAVITDDRDDVPLGRPHRDSGSEYEIPPNKLKFDRGNPTGHNIIFLSGAGYVYCFVQASGI